MSNRSVGDELEDKICQKFNVQKTAKSGAHWDNADLVNNNVLIECKVKNDCSSFRCPKSELSKLKKQANRSSKDWIYVMQDANGEVYVLTSLDYFQEITNGRL